MPATAAVLLVIFIAIWPTVCISPTGANMRLKLAQANGPMTYHSALSIAYHYV